MNPAEMKGRGTSGPKARYQEARDGTAEADSLSSGSVRQLLQRNEEIMKTKVMVLVSMLVFALAMMGQTATPVAPAAAGDAAKKCACCGDMANMKPGDKCPMMKDGKMADGKSCCGKDSSCCNDGKCAMTKDGKMADGKLCCGATSCCAGDKCPMMKKGKATTGASCCAKGEACCKGGSTPCCSRDKTAA